MRRNTMLDLHDHLMARIEAMGDEGIAGKALDREIKRSETTAKVALTMIANLRLALDTDKHLAAHSKALAGSILTPRLLSGEVANNGDKSK